MSLNTETLPLVNNDTKPLKAGYFSRVFGLFLITLKLGISSFGGPIAHLSYFRNEYVEKKKYLDEQLYSNVLALAQFLPGPTSSQVGMAVGVLRGGFFGSIVSFLGFTLPSALFMTFFAYFSPTVDFKYLHGLKVVAAAIVLHAVSQMAKKLTPDNKTKTIAGMGAVCALLIESNFVYILVIALGAVIGLFAFRKTCEEEESFGKKVDSGIHWTVSILCLVLFLVLLVSTFFVSKFYNHPLVVLFEKLYRSSALIIGGGHVILPALESEFVSTGLMSLNEFLTGYSLANTVPGPLFTFGTYIGYVIYGWTGAIVGTISIFLPGFFLLIGTFSIWTRICSNKLLKRSLKGINATVVGILLSAFYKPIFITAIGNSIDFSVATGLFVMLAVWDLPSILVVVVGGLVGAVLAFFGI
ncbi:hypothetical protein RCL1_000968 [Eukaryota sp. TZLM3-RCL]